MIYNCENNQTVRIIDFGHGDLTIGLACEEGSQISDRYAIMSTSHKAVGESRPEMVGTKADKINDATIFTFTGPESLKSLDMLIEDLHKIKANIQKRKKINNEFNELQEAAAPLVEYMRKHCNPHNKIIVTLDRIEVMSGEMGVPVEVQD